MSDLIDRQAAIDAINRLDIPEDMCVFEILSHITLAIGTLPSAQPEIVRCKDCKRFYANDGTASQCRYSGNKEGYCFMAERKETK